MLKIRNPFRKRKEARPVSTGARTTPAAVQWIITVIAVLMTVALTAVAFWLSYEHLHDVAAEHGLSGARAWAWPATLDTFIVIGEALILRASLVSKVDVWAWVLTAIGSAGSITLNITGVGTSGDALDYTVAAVPPVAALLAFGMLMRQLHTMIVAYIRGDTGPVVIPGARTVPPGVRVFDGDTETGDSDDEATDPGLDAMRHLPYDADLVANGDNGDDPFGSVPTGDTATEDDTTGYRGVSPVPLSPVSGDMAAGDNDDMETRAPVSPAPVMPGRWPLNSVVPYEYRGGYVPPETDYGPAMGQRGHTADLAILDTSLPSRPATRRQTTGITAQVREQLTADFGVPDSDIYASFGPETPRKSVAKAIARVRQELET